MENVWDLIYKRINTCHSFALTGTVESQPEKEVLATWSETSITFHLAWYHFSLYFHKCLITAVNKARKYCPNMNTFFSLCTKHPFLFIPPLIILHPPKAEIGDLGKGGKGSGDQYWIQQQPRNYSHSKQLFPWKGFPADESWQAAWHWHCPQGHQSLLLALPTKNQAWFTTGLT